MDKAKKKELRAQYANRHPRKGVIAWRSGERLWVSTSDDTDADHNSTLFQLKLGSFPNREMQKAYREGPETFTWLILRELDYDDPDDDYREDLELLLMECLEEHPEAERMRPGRRTSR